MLGLANSLDGHRNFLIYFESVEFKVEYLLKS